MMGNKERKIIRAENNPPINFTCGICKRVHPYVDDDLKCPDQEVDDGDVQEG